MGFLSDSAWKSFNRLRWVMSFAHHSGEITRSMRGKLLCILSFSRCHTNSAKDCKDDKICATAAPETVFPCIWTTPSLVVCGVLCHLTIR